MNEQSITLSQAKTLITRLAAKQSLLLLSPPGVGKSDVVHQAAAAAGLPCRSLLGTQIAPEDVSGIPRIIGERSVFCPPRILLPEDGQPFCLFLDELPATPPDIQKAFYSLLLERRVGEFPLPKGSWVVAAGNRSADRALVRSMSSALINRVLITHVEVNRKEWLVWAKANGVRGEILAFITYMPDALMRPVPRDPAPFSTPRAWSSLSRALDLVEGQGALSQENRRALAFGRVSAEDAAIFCALGEEGIGALLPIEEYFESPDKLPTQDTARWFIIHQLRRWIKRGELPEIDTWKVNEFLRALPNEFRFAVMVDLVDQWSALGAYPAMLDALREVTGLWSDPAEISLDDVAVEQARQALRLASASLPHLAGLARIVRVKASTRVPVAAVGPSGLIIVEPGLFAKLPLGDAAFILAHELMHLALDTSGRIGDADRLVGNFAHDYIINDMLAEELEREPPLGGLYSEGARQKSFEEWIVDLNKSAESGSGSGRQCWSPRGRGQFPGRRPRQAPSPMSRALADAGLVPPPEPPPRTSAEEDELGRGDLLDPNHEAELEPELSPSMREAKRSQVKQAAAKAAALSELGKKLQQSQQGASTGEPQRREQMLAALRAAYHTPWQLALQRWMDAVAPGERTYAPVWRGANRTDVVLPGRRREGWTLHIILDTSGSMENYLPTALGAIGYFCDSAGVFDVHVVQCDTEVTKDEWVEPMSLGNFKIAGFGYSDMRPAMHHLAEDPEVTAVLMLTDGEINILERAPPYHMLWVLVSQPSAGFNPPYGEVLRLGV